MGRSDRESMEMADRVSTAVTPDQEIDNITNMYKYQEWKISVIVVFGLEELIFYIYIKVHKKWNILSQYQKH